MSGNEKYGVNVRQVRSRDMFQMLQLVGRQFLWIGWRSSLRPMDM